MRSAARFPIGSSITLDQLAADPHPVLARLRSHEPVSWVGALGARLVTRYDLAHEVLRSPERFTVDDPRFSTAQVVGPSMLSLDGAEHDRHRAPFAPAFRRSSVERDFAATTRSIARRLVEQLAPAGEADRRERLAGPIAIEVIAEVLGLVDADAARLRSWYREIVAAVSAVSAGEPVPASGPAAYAELRAAVDRTVTHSGDSLLRAVGGTRSLTDVELASNTAIVLFGAVETAEGMIANLLWHLLAHPHRLDRLCREPQLVAAAVEESLRMEPAATLIDRYATGDDELGGVAIAAGDPVTVSLAGANRDPAVFADPERFDPGRSDVGRHLTFVVGPHACLGLNLARLEATEALHAVLDVLPDLRLDPARSNRPQGLVFRKPPAVVATW